MNSNFKVHPTFTNYAVSRDGEVYSFLRNRKLKHQTNRDGYLQVCLRKDKKSHFRLINRLVMETYDPIEDSHLYHAHHENRIRNDNRLKNLKWELIKEHMREHHKGKVMSDEARRKISESHKGLRHTEEARRKVSEANKGNQWNVGMLFWNNGTRTIRSKEWPGDGWVRGMK